MTQSEFDVVQDRDPELVEDEQVDDQLETLVDLPLYDAEFESSEPQDLEDDDDCDEEEEDGEVE